MLRVPEGTPEEVVALVGEPPAGTAPSPRAGLLRYLANASSLTAARIAGDGFSFLVFLVVARVYGIEGTGHYASAFAWAAFVAVIANPGISDYGIRECARAKQGGWRPIFARLLRLQGLAAAAGAATLAAALLIAQPPLAVVLMTVGLSVYLGGFIISHTLFVPAFAREAMTGPSLAELGCRAAAVAVILTLALAAHERLEIALLGFPLAGVAILAVGWRSARSLGGTDLPAVSRSDLLATAREAWPFAANEIVGQAYARTGIILLQLVAGAAATGGFATLLKLVEVGTAPLTLAVTAAFPGLSRAFHEDPPAFRRGAVDMLRVVLLLAGCLVMAFCFLVPWLLPVVFGPDFAALRPELPWIGGLAALSGIEIVYLRLLLASDRQGGVVGVLVAGTAVSVAANVALVPWFGVPGAVAASLVGMLTLVLAYGRMLCAVLPLRDQLAVIVRFAACLAAGSAAGFAAQAEAGPFGAVALAIAAFGVAGLATGFVPRRLGLG